MKINTTDDMAQALVLEQLQTFNEAITTQREAYNWRLSEMLKALQLLADCVEAEGACLPVAVAELLKHYRDAK